MVFVVAIGTLATAAATIWLGYEFHQFDEFEDEAALSCTPVVGITGASDITAMEGRNVAFLSVLDERGDAERGGLVRFDFDNPLDDTSWRDRTGGRPIGLNPGGIDLFEERLPSGLMSYRLFAVNKVGLEVLIFDVENDGSLTLAERLADPRLTSPNDIVATGPTSFYVSNDTASGRQTLRGKADFLVGLPTGSIFHYDGNSWSVATDGLRFPNGLAMSEDGSMLYVAEMRAEAIRRYARDPATEALEPAGRVELGSFPNNLSIDQEGRILVGAVPQPFAFKAYTEGLRDTAPSQILRVSGDEVEILYQDGGRNLSAATVATVVGGRTVIGSAADDKFLMCRS
jgi:arylesterase/paraoxonase